MTPTEAGRFCAQCDKVVHDLSAMNEAEARALLAAPRTRGLCVRYVYGADGRIAFGSEPARQVVPSTLLNRAKRATVVAALALPFASMACSPFFDMGDVPGDSVNNVDAGDAGDAGKAGDAADGDAAPENDADADVLPVSESAPR